jgi:hypothetical protein
MNIEEVKQARDNMNADITLIVTDFMENTGMRVSYISLDYLDVSTMGEEKHILNRVTSEVLLP